MSLGTFPSASPFFLELAENLSLDCRGFSSQSAPKIKVVHCEFMTPPKIHLPLFASFAFLMMAPLSTAATKDEYRTASINGLREAVSFGRAKGIVKTVLASPGDGKVHVVGRGEIMLISQLLLAGRQENSKELLELARDLVLACNRAALDGYDTPQLNSLEQIGFSLRELTLAVPQLEDLKLLTGQDALRAHETLKKGAEFLLKYKPELGDGNIDQRYALGVATVCKLFPDDSRVAQWKAWASKPVDHLLNYPDQKGLPGAKRRVLEKQGSRWKFVEDAKPFAKVQGVGISEDSSAYEASTIVSWMGIARLIGREAEIKTPAVEAFIDQFYQQIMPLGILPAYGDAEWNGSPALWIGIFEWAGATFHQPKYRAAADAIFRYEISHGQQIGDLSEAVEYADESLKVVAEPRSSVLLQRLSGRGESVPNKVILRGSSDGDGAHQAYVMMQATESLGHSHPYAGSISAYCAGGAVLLHSLGYDATATPLHQSFLVRQPDEPFLGFIGDPNGMRLAKIMPDGERLSGKIVCDDREVRSAAAHEDETAAYGNVVCDYLTASHPNRDFNGHAFLHTRELTLDKQSGLLCVLDTIESKDDVEAAFGPVWHVQRVLAKNAQGFVCQTDYQAKYDGKIDASAARPVWIAMSGPAGTNLNSVFWRFTARAGHSELPQENHLTAEWRGKVTAGEKISFLTVLVPLAPGTTAPPDEVKISSDGGRPRVKFGNRVLLLGE